jgi:hypothetical protein
MRSMIYTTMIEPSLPHASATRRYRSGSVETSPPAPCHGCCKVCAPQDRERCTQYKWVAYSSCDCQILDWKRSRAITNDTFHIIPIPSMLLFQLKERCESCIHYFLFASLTPSLSIRILLRAASAARTSWSEGRIPNAVATRGSTNSDPRR